MAKKEVPRPSSKTNRIYLEQQMQIMNAGSSSMPSAAASTGASRTVELDVTDYIALLEKQVRVVKEKPPVPFYGSYG